MTAGPRIPVLARPGRCPAWCVAGSHGAGNRDRHRGEAVIRAVGRARLIVRLEQRFGAVEPTVAVAIVQAGRPVAVVEMAVAEARLLGLDVLAVVQGIGGEGGGR